MFIVAFCWRQNLYIDMVCSEVVMVLSGWNFGCGTLISCLFPPSPVYHALLFSWNVAWKMTCAIKVCIPFLPHCSVWREKNVLYVLMCLRGVCVPPPLCSCEVSWCISSVPYEKTKQWKMSCSRWAWMHGRVVAVSSSFGCVWWTCRAGKKEGRFCNASASILLLCCISVSWAIVIFEVWDSGVSWW